MERLTEKFHLYLHYFHHIDITLANINGTPACIRKIRLVEQGLENKARKDGDEEHPINLD